LRLALALHEFWKVRGYLSEGRMWLADACARSQRERAALVALAQAYAADLAQLQDAYGPAVAWAEASATLACTLDQKAALATALGRWAGTPTSKMIFWRRTCFAERLSLCRVLGKPAQIPQTLHDLAYLAMMQGDCAQAQAYYEEELALSRQAGLITGSSGRCMVWAGWRSVGMNRDALRRCMPSASRAPKHRGT